MNIPDGPDELTEFYDSAYERDLDDLDVLEMLADEANDEVTE
jgi:hypothetical protein